MNAVQLWAAQPGIERAGLTLLHFLWEGFAVAVLYGVARLWVRRPSSRYILACSALAAMAAAPLLTWVVLHPAASDAVSMPYAAAVSPAASNALRTSVAIFTDGIPRARATFLPWVVAIWMAGATAFWARLLAGWMMAERLRVRQVRPAPPEWQQTLERLGLRIGVSRPVRLLVSSLVPAPVVVGWLRPVVLAPVGALAGLPPDQMEALLLHELAHIRRHDYLVNVVQSVVEAFLFYHPAVWWVSGHIRAERELCCDDAAISACGDVLTYARALVELAAPRPRDVNPAMAATGGSLAHRIARLAGRPVRESLAFSGPGAAAAAVLLAVTALVVFGHAEERPKFEVASVKPTSDRGFRSVRPLPGRLTADAPVLLLIQNAYSVQSFQVVGGPDWIDGEHFAIEAKAAGNASRAELFQMLQSLLEERFHLKFHRETREMPVYALAPGKNGVKLSPPQKDGCAEPSQTALPAWQGGRIQPPGRGQPPAAPCGRVGVMMEPGGALMRGGKVPMPELVRSLSMILGRTVIDRTGVTDPFDFSLQFVPDETTGALPPPPPLRSNSGAPTIWYNDSASGTDLKHPPITIALQQQLGLRLESTKGPVEVIVVDHLEKPAAN